MSKQAKSITLFHQEFTVSGGAEHTLLETMDFLIAQGFQVTCYAAITSPDCFPERIKKYPIKALFPKIAFLPHDLLIIMAVLCFPLRLLI
jgi:hypothetical protein